MYESIDINEIDFITLDNNLIDLREKYEYLLGHIDNSINIPYNHLITNPNIYLDINKKYYLYCESGSRSMRMCNYLNSLGYNTVDLIGGYSKYRNV